MTNSKKLGSLSFFFRKARDENYVELQATQLHKMVADALAEKDYKLAIASCRQLNTVFPNYFDGWLIAGVIHQTLNKPKAGLISTARALALRPNEPKALMQRVECLLAVRQIAQGIELLLGLAQQNLTNDKISANFVDKTAMLLSSQNLHQQSLEQYDLAISLNPDCSSLHYNRATVLRFLGKTNEALEALHTCLRINPLDFEAQGMRSSLQKQNADSNHIEELENVLANKNLFLHGKVNICYALAKELDDLNQFDKSFAYLQQGARQRKKQMAYDINIDLAVFESIKQTFTADLFERVEHGDDSQEPIFIIGLPRTGTTLVERILSSHSEVFTAGEIDDFGREMVKLVEQTTYTAPLSRTEIVKQSAAVNCQVLGTNYIQATRPATGRTARFIDKLPFNYLYAGLIHKALPRAKIINIKRHPMAACYAIYKQLFRDAYPFSYDLDDLAQYYIAYHGLIEHWKKVLPNVMYELSYEDVVADLEKESRNLIAFCGLDWQEQCLRFYENKQSSTTASASQVRQPIYTSSLNRWRHYEKQLKPLQNRLMEAGISAV